MGVLRTEKAMVLGLLAMVLSFATIAPGLNYIQANAQQTDPDKEDPHTDAAGTMQEDREVVDDRSMHITYVFTSEDLRKKYGYSQLLREEIVPLPENYQGPASEKKVAENVKMKLIHESEADKVDKYQKAKNDGIPMVAYRQWKVVVEEQTGANAQKNGLNSVLNPILSLFGVAQTIQPDTHVEKWAWRQVGTAYEYYDPIDLIWDDTNNASSDVLNAALSRMNGNGWSQITCYPSSTLYVIVNGYFTAQNANEYKYTGGICDQYHVRLWRITADRAIGAAHQEVVDTRTFDIRHIGGPNYWENDVQPYHIVISFENGETQARNTFSGCWTTSSNSHAMSNTYTREYWNSARTTLLYSGYNNGYASQINQLC